MLVPDAPDQPIQVIDVRDLAGWLTDGAERSGRHLRRRRPCSHVRRLDRVGPRGRRATPADRAGGGRDWLLGAWRRPVDGPGIAAAVGRRARTADPVRGRGDGAGGLRHRPRVDLLADLLDWERAQGLDRPPAGAHRASRAGTARRLLGS